MPGGKAACGKHGATEADGGDTQGVAQQALHFRQVAVWPGQLRDACRYRPKDGNAEAVEAEQANQQHEQRHYREGCGQARVAPWQPDEQAQGGQADDQCDPVNFPQALEEVDQAEDETVALDLEAHHLGQLPGDQAQADTVEVADQDRPREEAGDETGPRQARGNQHHADQHGDDHRQFDDALRVAHGQRCHGTGDHRAGGGVGADHQLARATDQRIDHHR